MEKIYTSNAPDPVGPYNQAVKSNNLLFISGQLGIDPATGKMVGGNLEQQTHQVMKNISAILESEGLAMENLVKTTILITDISQFQTANKIYAEHLKDPFPARATYEVCALPLGGLIEIEAVAEYK